MAFSIQVKEHPYILENDRNRVKDLQTIFYLKPKTVKETTETASNYAKVQIRNRRKNRDEIDPVAMQSAENQEWLKAVIRIENFFITPEAPEEAYKFFAKRAEEQPENFKVEEIDGLKVIRIITATEDADRRYIFWVMDSAETEEIFRVATNYSELKAGEKNV